VTSKAAIVERLGEKAVLLPSLIGEALAANDRIKLRLSLLQEVALHAQAPQYEAHHFGRDKGIAGLGELAPDAFVAGARLLGPGKLLVPGVGALLAGVADDLATMLAPLQAAGDEAAQPLGARVEILTNQIPEAVDDQLELRVIDELTSANHAERDSVHLLVMDLHKALNRLVADTAVEILDGAQVHALAERDRISVKAFMRGLHRTAGLAFGHPGLGTTAVRAADALIIQNDIGTTDAHVLVVHVTPAEVTVTYTDVHRPRTKFFISLFEEQGASWSSLAEQKAPEFKDDIFYLVTGRYAGDNENLDRFLEFLGSRIVFLIDWNKARRALHTFVGKNTAIDLLAWAAKHDFGHRAFLALGGADLIFDAVDRAASGRIRYGVRLDQALGSAQCQEFLQNVLRDASQGLAAGRTYYAFDPKTSTYWAGAALLPSMGNVAAQIDVQDDGAYDLFVRHPGGGWTAYEDGLGTRQGTRCTIVVPTPIPTTPPANVNATDSSTIEPVMYTRRAPSAIWTPISRVRCVTAANMMLATPTPPMTNVSAPIVPRNICSPIMIAFIILASSMVFQK